MGAYPVPFVGPARKVVSTDPGEASRTEASLLVPVLPDTVVKSPPR